MPTATRTRQFLSILVTRDLRLFSFSQKAVMIQISAGFIDLRLVLTLIKSNPAYCLILKPSLVNFPPIPQIRSAERIREIGGNFSYLKYFLFSFLRS